MARLINTPGVTADQPEVSSLTRRERECLQLVRRGLESKEIARELGLSHRTVDAYIDNARRRLKATSRRHAAELLAAFEGDQAIPYRILPEPQTLPAAPLAGADGASSTQRQGLEDEPDVSDAMLLKEPSAVFHHLPLTRGFPLPFRTDRRPVNDLGTGELLGVTAVLAGGLAMSATLSVIALVLLMHFLERIVLVGG
ncbi:helix-turn-helix domain-containing protein [Sphingomonas quercus]|uniref:Helix-turn-helix transcriptional regulator n=1 Tax=Sphingomonas quercus TaxID=2842451 RepID=A0ABS6BG23_9SPHN|nr:helix-turn-helix transcriptional regulator [Sphingomonas quercus]MBU3076431.1 helix-turn-helix transcriptional regulator [Sphingomonas quercus]